jgi:signal transduction histidine kinase
VTAARGRSPFASVRGRFALAYAGLLAGTGVALAILFYTYLRFVPGYTVSPSAPSSVDSSDPETVEQLAGEPTALSNLVLGGLVLGVIVLAMWVGWLIAGRLLHPLTTINDAALRVSSGDLDHRVRLTGPDDEFANLARTFDSMLDRLQHSLEAHRRFAANASHELHTPLSTNKTMLDVALDDPEAADLLELARRLRTTNQHNIDTVDALLDLARIDEGGIEKTRVDLRELADPLLEGVVAEAAARSITLTARLDSAPSRGSATLLSRLISNLLQNAVRHNLTGGTVTVRTGIHDARATIEVENTGKRLSAEVLATLTEPFIRTRGRTAHIHQVGHGLGLSIVQSIVDAHDGQLILTPRSGGGLAATVTLPSTAER